ncbi:MAG: RHS repeat-associated core domain-containing protein [Clostridia bacterium]|nr:RHS repeat-associated core domain-containing protein [Clostridia bacterium]
MYENDTWSDVLTNVKDVYYDNSRGIDSNSADARINSIANRVLGNRYDTVDMSAKLFGNRNNRTEIVDGEYSIISDAIGNITSYNGFTYSYLGRQLTGLYNNESGILYGYNADGQRISKSYDSIGGFALDYDYYYNGSTLAGFRLYITEGVDTQEYLVSFMYDENGEPFGFTVNGDSYYYVRNAQNDIFLIVDSDNQGVVLYQYDAWGNITACYDTTDGFISLINPYTYRGYYYDIETGYYYLNSRYYSPQLHRFISADGTINANKDILGDNLFAYCSNNPINNCDDNGCGKISNWFKSVGNKIKTWLNTVPTCSFTIPSTKQITTNVSGFILDALSGSLSQIKKKLHTIINYSKNYESNAVASIKPYGEVLTPNARAAKIANKAAVAISSITLLIDLANTWTENNSNTNGQRLLKSACQCTSATMCYLVGSAAVSLGSFGGPAGVIVGAGVAVGFSIAIDYCWDRYYEMVGIE